MVQEIGDQHQITAAAKFDLEYAADKQVIVIGDSDCLRILRCELADHYFGEKKKEG
jgi:hypothetical protein